MPDYHSNPQKFIGGTFGLEDLGAQSGQSLPFLEGRRLLLVNARSGLRLLVERLRPRCTWLPSYLCDSLVRPLKAAAASFQFYPVDYHLHIPSLNWLEDIQPGDLVVFIAYFGFPLQQGLAQAARERGAWALEDDSQALLSAHHDPQAHFRLYSLRKFIGVPDGAILALIDPDVRLSPRLAPPPPRWWLQALNACLLRREFDRHGGDQGWSRLSNLAESAMPLKPYRMSEISRLVMSSRVDYQALAARRIANYRLLLERLGEFALFPYLPDGVVPLGFPVRVRNRNEVFKQLVDQQVHPLLHWDLRGWAPASFQDSQHLSRNILTLICDQRYDDADMHRTAEIVSQIGSPAPDISTRY